ncbi:MAG: VanZ family protein [Carnobacterium sp.]|uniref:VanZ family protein n=1 Tax=Carnobacterium TaxID=2747 RepID=UPI000704E197|nr:VanZ family protein [Carnobacterium maltaromaticum]MDT1945439.1 VanZ family protein [Carnobacterium maltaromaticum]MDT1999943.1 VanZ family protein [Carnobacterium maltaromaticum]MDW5523440.1 VanZ family protein [Carnobacterium maltaromaticum]TFJ29244.1 VanZ family protein [Carnobacterium maltaromaticum]TFJ33413.1 VanZ family protein [Carnobacterium maltaromaticum]
MFFLQNLYEFTESNFGDTINHFPLIKLIFYSVDRTLRYFLVWLLIRGIYLLYKHLKGTKIKVAREFVVQFFVFYVILLFQLTVFRGEYSITNVYIELRPLSEVNWQPFTETFKLTQGTSLFDFYYNLYGNIFWFIPLGFCVAYLSQNNHPFLRTFFIGLFCSIAIETMQFLFRTGIADVDDVMFNTTGALIGFVLYEVYFLLKKLFSKQKRRKEAV